MDLNLVCGPDSRAVQSGDTTGNATALTPGFRIESELYQSTGFPDTNENNEMPLISPPPSASKANFAGKNGESVAGEEKKLSTRSVLEKYRNELRDVAEKCKVLSQFAEQYGPERNKFNAQPSDDLVIDMARKAYEVLMVFMTIRRERMSASADNDTMEYIRKRRTVLSPARTKTRKRSKRADAAQPNSCRSCGISETPEWRRGPDDYAKLNKKRATEISHPLPGSGSPADSQVPSKEASALLYHGAVPVSNSTDVVAAVTPTSATGPTASSQQQHHDFTPALPHAVHQQQHRAMEYPYHPANTNTADVFSNHSHYQQQRTHMMHSYGWSQQQYYSQHQRQQSQLQHERQDPITPTSQSTDQLQAKPSQVSSISRILG
ncbi:hypothetical protein H4R24_002232 [Coemansia sp. RSA 988]|nr:hypothetical protein H4R24_002232 [Coemansia sp. RSA 988]